MDVTLNIASNGSRRVGSALLVVFLVTFLGIMLLSSTDVRAETSQTVCPTPSSGHAACQALKPTTVGASYSGSGEGGGFSPSDLRSAYNLPSTGGSGQTVAIVDAYNDPNAESDLKVYREHYGLSACTTAGGCFKKVNQTGGSTYPESESSWSEEISLDLDMVSAICSGCHILLVEANTNSFGNLLAAEDEAVALGATEISNSWSSTEEFSGETSYDPYFDHPGIPITAASGDYGYGTRYPAASPYVISIGGTRLEKASNSRGWSEEAWSGTGSGCSLYETKPVWQSDSGCSKRAENDVAAVASPETPVSVYDSYNESGWLLFGGTSVATPIVAAVEGLSGGYTRSLGASALYQDPENLFDITSGSDGTCTISYFCNATTGYDGPTGLGTLDGIPRVAAGKAAAVSESNGNQYVYFRGANRALWHEVWNASKDTWTLSELGGQIPGNPSATLAANGNQYVYVRGYDNALYEWYWNASESIWRLNKIGGETPGNPSALLESNGNQYVYLRGFDSALYEWFWNASKNAWTLYKIGGEMPGNPSALLESGGNQSVFVRGYDGEIYQWFWNSSKNTWTLNKLGGSAAGDPSAILQSNGAPEVYFRGTNRAIWHWWWTPSTSTWSLQELGGSAAGDPTAVLEPNGVQNVVFRGTNGAIWQWFWSPSSGTWSLQELGSHAAGDPVAILQSTGNPDIYFMDEGAGLSQWFFAESKWFTGQICTGPCGI